MRAVADRRRARSFLRWSQFILFTAAGVALAYCVCVLAGARLYRRHETLEFRRLLQQESRLKPPAAQALTPRRPARPPVIANDGLIGLIEIPRLGISAVLAEGTGDATLQRAVGHIEGTSLPGQPGNVGIAGHRDTFFRPLRSIRKNDTIALATVRGQYRYRVVSTKVVAPDAVGVLAPSSTQTLTLVTCYPFYYVGPAPERFIVRAERIPGGVTPPDQPIR
jgi:sortase A